MTPVEPNPRAGVHGTDDGRTVYNDDRLPEGGASHGTLRATRTYRLPLLSGRVGRRRVTYDK